jgi:hypothetical protein
MWTYDAFPRPVVEACEEVLRAYTGHTAPTCDPALPATPPGIVLAEGVALEALCMLTETHGSTSDLLFSDLFEADLFADMTPTMLRLLRFLRARLAGQDPVLRLNPSAGELGLPFLLLAGHALILASGQSSGSEAAAHTLADCLQRLATSPAQTRYPVGDLAFTLDNPDEADDERFYRDALGQILSEAVPLLRVLPTPDRSTAFLVPDLTARPDIADLLRILATDPPQGGADTATYLRAFAGTNNERVSSSLWLVGGP